MVITGLVTAILVFLQIRRCPASQRQRNRRRWLVMGLIVAGLVLTITGFVIAAAFLRENEWRKG